MQKDRPLFRKRVIHISLLLAQLVSTSLMGYIDLRAPAREWLEEIYLPSLSGKILYVGIGTYTQKYYRLCKNPKLFETIDYDETKAAYGSPYGHYIEDLVTFEPEEKYDHVSMFGIMGHPPTVTTSIYKIIDDTTISEAFSQAHKLVKVGGTLQLGPNYKDFPGQDAQFWLEKFKLSPLDKYEIIFCGLGTDNIIWWGRKLRE